MESHIKHLDAASQKIQSLPQLLHAQSAPTPLPTPIQVNKLRVYLDGYPITSKNYLINGFLNGFSLDFVGSRVASTCVNLLSALQNPDAVNDKLAKELHLGRIAGPFPTRPLSSLRISPLGLIPKKAPGEFRLIHHLSFPFGKSVNSQIPKIASCVHYASIDDAVRLIRRTGRGCALAKTDVKNAFRLIPVSPRDYNLLGIFWQGQFYYDRCLPMGCASSCKIFESFSSALEWIGRHKLGIPGILHILDDFLIIERDRAACSNSLSNFLRTCDELGVPMAPEKTVGPSTTLSFAGIELDTCEMEARLPQEKLDKCRHMLRDFLRRKKVSLREMQSLIGLLNFTCCVVLPGRTFLRRMINVTVGVRRPTHSIRLKREVKADLQMWLQFLDHYNGKSFFLDFIWFSSDLLHLYTDSSGSLGYGAIFGHKWFYGEWPSKWKSKNIIILEMFPIVLSVGIWADKLANRCVMFHTDNKALAEVINKKTTKEKELLVLVRALVLFCLQHNILFKAVHLPGLLNTKADALSRLQVDKFKSLDKAAELEPTAVPPHLLPESWEI